MYIVTYNLQVTNRQSSFHRQPSLRFSPLCTVMWLVKPNIDTEQSLASKQTDMDWGYDLCAEQTFPQSSLSTSHYLHKQRQK